MRRSKKAPAKAKAATETAEEARETADRDSDDEDVKGGFFGCYLLSSRSPRHKGHTYIGFTVNPRRRIKQHNGEMRSGTWRTKHGHPWEMVLCIYGFLSNVSALQPAKVNECIDRVIKSPLHDIAIPLSGFQWEYSKGNFNHWRPLFLHFEIYFKTYLCTRKDLLLSDEIFEEDSFPSFESHANSSGELPQQEFF